MSSVEGEQPKTIVVDLNEKTTPKDSAVKRTFTVLQVTRDDAVVDFNGGRFQSKTPAGAARKAANQVCKKLYKDEDNCEIEIVIRETTKSTPAAKNAASKEYRYKASRTLNTKAVDFKGTAGAVNIPFKYAMNLKSLKKDSSGKVVEEPVPVETDGATVEEK